MWFKNANRRCNLGVHDPVFGRVRLDCIFEPAQQTRRGFQPAFPDANNFPAVFAELPGNLSVAFPVLGELLPPESSR